MGERKSRGSSPPRRNHALDGGLIFPELQILGSSLLPVSSSWLGS